MDLGFYVVRVGNSLYQFKHWKLAKEFADKMQAQEKKKPRRSRLTIIFKGFPPSGDSQAVAWFVEGAPTVSPQQKRERNELKQHRFAILKNRAFVVVKSSGSYRLFSSDQPGIAWENALKAQHSRVPHQFLCLRTCTDDSN
jgi:hypothetical protein